MGRGKGQTCKKQNVGRYLSPTDPPQQEGGSPPGGDEDAFGGRLFLQTTPLLGD